MISLLHGEELIQDHKDLVRRLRWQRLFSHPLKSIRCRLGMQEGPVNWKKEIVKSGRWPAEMSGLLEKLPDEFFSSYSLRSEGALWLYREILRSRPKVIVECGSGLSTIMIALALRDLAGQDSTRRFISLESDETWLGLTRHSLTLLHLTGYVSLTHAPIAECTLGGESLYTYRSSALDGMVVDFLFIDGPSPEYGRLGVLPSLLGRLSDSALVVLDDACRLSEKQCVAMWTRQCHVPFVGYVPVGHGLAILRRRSCT